MLFWGQDKRALSSTLYTVQPVQGRNVMSLSCSSVKGTDTGLGWHCCYTIKPTVEVVVTELSLVTFHLGVAAESSPNLVVKLGILAQCLASCQTSLWILPRLNSIWQSLNVSLCCLVMGR